MTIRIDKAEAALAAYSPHEYNEYHHEDRQGEESATLVDLITDLGHFAREAGLEPFEQLVDRARTNLVEEEMYAQQTDHYATASIRNIAQYHERQGHTTEASKLYNLYNQAVAQYHERQGHVDRADMYIQQALDLDEGP